MPNQDPTGDQRRTHGLTHDPANPPPRCLYCPGPSRSTFADPGGRSALRRTTRRNPRNLPCPTCKAPNALTPADRARGYQCDPCANQAEGYGP